MSGPVSGAVAAGILRNHGAESAPTPPAQTWKAGTRPSCFTVRFSIRPADTLQGSWGAGGEPGEVQIHVNHSGYILKTSLARWLLSFSGRY